jgi:peroxiredoxin-like protein
MYPYRVNLNWIGERKGEISSPELDSKIYVATPPQFPKGIKGIWSPEHLFTAAVNSCFMTTFLAIAENSKLEYSEFSCESEGILNQVDGKYLMTEIILHPKLKLLDMADKEKAERIFRKSEKACVISNSIKSSTRLEGEIIC